MAMYATASELASYLQQDLDAATATLLLELASAEFCRRADTAFTATTVTFSIEGGPGTELALPYHPVTAVSAVRLNGATITGWSLVKDVLYRRTGFGTWYAFPPDLVEVDLTYGYTTVPDDVKAAVLETAAAAYSQPVGAVTAETVDDYSVRYAATGGGVQLTPNAAKLADDYRGVLIA